VKQRFQGLLEGFALIAEVSGPWSILQNMKDLKLPRRWFNSPMRQGEECTELDTDERSIGFLMQEADS
jgi:hypothetical protein